MNKVLMLLREVHDSVLKSKTYNFYRQERGDDFSVFNVLGFSRPEEHLHSPFISYLLNPKGTHGLGDRFLKLFIDYCLDLSKHPSFEFDTYSAVVRREIFIGKLNIRDEGKSTGGKLDIIIVDRKNNCIIIENKFGADDKEKQMERYYNFACKNYNKKFILLYLSKNGESPSKISIDNYYGKCDLLSYKPNETGRSVIEWLERCIEISALYPLVREVIKQYVIYLKNNLDMAEGTDEILDIVLKSRENIDSTLDILSKGYEIKRNLRSCFLNKLRNLVKDYGLDFYDTNLNDLINLNPGEKWIIIRSENKRRYCIAIGYYSLSEGVRYGFSFCPGIEPNEDEILSGYRLETTEKNDKSFPLGWDYLWCSERGVKNGKWYDWDDCNTLRDMYNGKIISFFKDYFEYLKVNGVLDLL